MKRMPVLAMVLQNKSLCLVNLHMDGGLLDHLYLMKQKFSWKTSKFHRKEYI